ncbi:MAG: hypothetical protein HYX27_18555 [Acidobacteria bacterium]|nr:hypothetical protein [Acidobacteriota bacterium]
MNRSRRHWLLTAASLAAAPRADIRTLTAGPSHHFFGYYAVSPWNRAGDKMICVESTFQNRMPRPNETADIVEVNPQSGATRRITETRAWNLQQGCMLNWSPNDPATILFNDAVSGEIISAALHLGSGKRRTYARAIESVAPNGRYASCVTYGRLARLRPVVGYAAAKDPNPNDNHPSNDGVHILDLDSGKSKLAVSLQQIYDYLAPGHPGLKEKALFIQHTVINPASTRMFFLARTIENGALTSAMFTANLDGGDLREVVPYGKGVSHFAWRGAGEIMATFKFDARVRHVLFNDEPSPKYTVIGPEFLDADGHCSFGPDPQLLVTDRNIPNIPAKRLMLYHLGRKEGIVLGEFPMKTPTGETYLSTDLRCDLHPRWKSTGHQICFDALDTRTWTRQLHIATLKA